MKVNGAISSLLARRVHNEHDYYHQIVYPLLDYLGFPSPPDDTSARWPQFPIRNPTGDGWLKLDYLTAIGSIPMLIIEGKHRATLFEDALRQASAYGRNFEPRPNSGIRGMTVPFLLVAAGNSARMFRAVIRGISTHYDLIQDGNHPAFLEWPELLREADTFRDLPEVALPPAAGLAPAAPSTVITETELLKAEFAKQFFDDLYSAIFPVRALKRYDERRVILFSRLVRAARAHDKAELERIIEETRLPTSATGKVREVLAWRQGRMALRQLSGATVGRAYRDFITSDQTRKGLKLFTGNSQQISLPEHLRRRDGAEKNTGRYFTPGDIIQQMVRLIAIRPTDRVIDPFCGSGGFLAEVAMAVDQGVAESFVEKQLVGIDEDPFCVEASRTLLGLMFPRCENRLNVFLHNCLYANPPNGGDYREDPRAERFLEPGTYDVVIGNPPGNKRYSGSNAGHVATAWAEKYGDAANLWDHVFFVRRCIELANATGGRICILVNDGFLANERFGYLRNEVLAECEIRAVISLPRVFKNNAAKMSLLYMTRTGAWDRKSGAVAPWAPQRKALLASVPEVAEETDPESGSMRRVKTNIYAELEHLVDDYRNMESKNPTSGEGPGLVAIHEILESLGLRRDGGDENPD